MSAPTLPSQRLQELIEKWRTTVIGSTGTNPSYLKCADELEPFKVEVAALEARLIEAEKSGKLFCAEQCEEGPGWGECEECGCHLFAIKKALHGVGVVGEA